MAWMIDWQLFECMLCFFMFGSGDMYDNVLIGMVNDDALDCFVGLMHT